MGMAAVIMRLAVIVLLLMVVAVAALVVVSRPVVAHRSRIGARPTAVLGHPRPARGGPS